MHCVVGTAEVDGQRRGRAAGRPCGAEVAVERELRVAGRRGGRDPVLAGEVALGRSVGGRSRQCQTGRHGDQPGGHHAAEHDAQLSPHEHLSPVFALVSPRANLIVMVELDAQPVELNQISTAN